MRKFSCLVAVAMAIGCGDDEPRTEFDAGPETDMSGLDMSGLDMEMPMVDMGDTPVDMGDTPIDMGGDTADMGEGTPDMGEAVDMFTPAPTCDDGVRNGDETGVDCGGETCELRCPEGAMCSINADCASETCFGGTCQATRCDDRTQNGMETGVDCGGPDCDPCGLGQGCDTQDDCAMGMCTGGFCVADHCFDGERNASESDVDCGGSDCGPCGPGLACRVTTDCAMGTCEDGFCRTIACRNGVLDAGEVDVDCGGECVGCDDGTTCTIGDDCFSGRCEGAICTSCGDGTQNGDESDVDCGGTSCRRCFGGETCMDGSDCTTGMCTDGLCEGAPLYYEEDFSAGDGGWVAGGDALWEYAMPADGHIAMAFTGTSVWVTDADADYPTSTDGYVESPPIDLSAAVVDPVIELAVIYDSESGYDGMWVELSTDGGSNYSVVGTGDAENWYNNTDDEWWDGTQDWIVAKALLVGAAGNSDVRVRIHFSADFSNVAEGAAFDDVRIREDVCFNGVLDANESDVDCGGDCGPCDPGLMCVMDTDCGSMVCDLGVCVSCDDGIQNGDETDVDCGGSVCDACADGSVCAVDADCDSSVCDAGSCVSCDDGLLNGGETDIDCGGPTCLSCTPGLMCSAASDCVLDTCSGGVCDSLPTIYQDDFEGGDGGLVSSGTTSSWAYGMPAGDVIDSAASGANAWVTNLTGDYADDEVSILEMPTLDLSSAPTDPVISFDLWRDTEDGWDGLWIEVSTDGGSTWDKLLDDGSFGSWYNNPPSNDGWFDGESSGYEPRSGVLLGTAGEADVRVRFVFDSDGSTQQEGVAIDNLRVGYPGPDLSVEVLPSVERCASSIVVVTNVGTTPVTGFALELEADGSTSSSSVMALLAPGESFSAEVAAASMLTATVTAAADADASNDSASRDITASFIAVTDAMRYLETFEMSDGRWTAGGTNADWEWGMPTDTLIGSADSGSNAWVTDLSSNYSSDQLSYLTSPCFDMTGMSSDPTVSFSRIYDLEPTNDHVHVEVSLDGGVTWNKLGAFGTGMNWYNDVLGDFWDGVSGGSDFWTRSSHPLAGAAGRNAVRIRFVMETNDSTTEEGFGMDDVIIQ